MSILSMLICRFCELPGRFDSADACACALHQHYVQTIDALCLTLNAISVFDGGAHRQHKFQSVCQNMVCVQFRWGLG